MGGRRNSITSKGTELHWLLLLILGEMQGVCVCMCARVCVCFLFSLCSSRCFIFLGAISEVVWHCLFSRVDRKWLAQSHTAGLVLGSQSFPASNLMPQPYTKLSLKMIIIIQAAYNWDAGSETLFFYDLWSHITEFIWKNLPTVSFSSNKNNLSIVCSFSGFLESTLCWIEEPVFFMEFCF